jgi:hypothetical protein
MATTEQLNGFFILPSFRSDPKGPQAPAIRVTLVKNSVSLIKKDVVAMLDTGSSTSAIDEDFARDADLEHIRDVEGMSGMGVSRKIRTYRCGIFLEELKQLDNYECGAMPFKQAGKNFLVILGMDFIKNFDMEINVGKNEVLLRRPI